MDTAGKSRTDRIQRIGKICPGRCHAGSRIIDSPRRVPSAHRMLGFENLLRIHAGEIVIALVELADMVEAEPAVFAGPVMAAPGTIDWWRAKFARFRASLNRAGLAPGFDAAVKAVGFSFGGSFGQIRSGWAVEASLSLCVETPLSHARPSVRQAQGERL